MREKILCFVPMLWIESTSHWGWANICIAMSRAYWLGMMLTRFLMTSLALHVSEYGPIAYVCAGQIQLCHHPSRVRLAIA